jgi:hypothetical protein
VNVLRSLKWPGAVTVAKSGKFVGIYLGDGVKMGDCSFNPTTPPEVMPDPDEQKEMPEPTPLHEPVAVAEPETQAEGDGEADDA